MGFKRSFDRAAFLFERKRPGPALRELEGVSGTDLERCSIHGLRSHCLGMLGKPAEAVQEAEAAIASYPDSAYGHYALACAWIAADDLTRAEAAIRETLRLEPEDAVYRSLHAAILFDGGKPEDTLAEASRALEEEPGHAQALRLRSRALKKLGRMEEAESEALASLAMEPESSLTHAVLGGLRLERGDARGAERSFREALRLNPHSEEARKGVLSALQAQFPLLIWQTASEPLMDAYLFLDRTGRTLLSPARIWRSKALFLCSAASLAYGGLGLLSGATPFYVLSAVSAFMALPLALAGRAGEGWPRALALILSGAAWSLGVCWAMGMDAAVPFFTAFLIAGVTMEHLPKQEA